MVSQPLCEATYAKKEERFAKEYKHLTSEQAATTAKKAKCNQLILLHTSQRYENNESVILNEAKKIFPNTILAEDLMKIEV